MINKTDLWVFRVSTVLLTLVLLIGGYSDVLGFPHVTEVIVRVGYPLYILPFLGVLKILGAIALWVKIPKELREWAYAGIGFDFIGAAYSHYASGDPMPDVAVPLALFFILMVSRFYREKVYGGKNCEK